MLFFEGEQCLAGIDSINLMIWPYLYDFLDYKKPADPKNRISIIPNKRSIQLRNNVCVPIPNYLLHISGEFISPHMPIKETIAKAISLLITRKTLNIFDRANGISFDIIPESFIRENLFLFVSGISDVEFCFDFEPKNIWLSESAKVMDTNDKLFREILKTKLKKRTDCLFKIGDTYYSNDYNKRRKSTIKLYNRETKLLKKNNEYPASFIRNNPYKVRIEFYFKKNRNSPYLNFSNLDGNYQQIIERFTPYLAKKYKKYFLNKIIVNSIGNPYFAKIYALAHSDAIKSGKLLKASRHQKRDAWRFIAEQNYLDLMHKLKQNKQNYDVFMWGLPDSYFVEWERAYSYSPFDMMDEERILFKEDGFVFLKDNWIRPKFTEIDD